jgi:hypothetical protein
MNRCTLIIQGMGSSERNSYKKEEGKRGEKIYTIFNSFIPYGYWVYRYPGKNETASYRIYQRGSGYYQKGAAVHL